jgi:transcriptional regulator with XRE-family HTH domain
MRREAGVSQVELSRRLGKPQPFVSNIERGVRRIDLIEFCAVIRALGGDPQAAFDELVKALPRKIEI